MKRARYRKDVVKDSGIRNEDCASPKTQEHIADSVFFFIG